MRMLKSSIGSHQRFSSAFEIFSIIRCFAFRRSSASKQKEENNRMYPTLFPKGFQFGHDDPVFAKET